VIEHLSLFDDDIIFIVFSCAEMELPCSRQIQMLSFSCLDYTYLPLHDTVLCEFSSTHSSELRCCGRLAVACREHCVRACREHCVRGCRRGGLAGHRAGRQGCRRGGLAGHRAGRQGVSARRACRPGCRCVQVQAVQVHALQRRAGGQAAARRGRGGGDGGEGFKVRVG
jgi:hypothetical protein